MRAPDTNARALAWALVMTTTFLFAEVVGAFVFGSLALLSDAGHMLTDVVALVIALIANRFAAKPADDKRTFGYRRLEILGAAFNALLLFAVAIYVVFEGVRRLREPQEVQSIGMLVVASIGLMVNLASMRLLSAGRETSINVKGAYLEVWADMAGSIGVLVAAVLIRFTRWTWIDPVVAIGIGLWVLPRTWELLRETTNTLLEGVPHGYSLSGLRTAVAAVRGVRDVHDLHVWSMGSADVTCTAHVTIPEGVDADEVRSAVAETLARRFGITHCTVQVEGTAAAPDENTHR